MFSFMQVIYQQQLQILFDPNYYRRLRNVLKVIQGGLNPEIAQNKFIIPLIIELTSIVTNSEGKYFICKRINANNAQVPNYFELLKEISHPNIVSVKDSIIEKDFVYVIEQYCEQGDIAFHMQRRNKRKGRFYPQQTIAKWILQAIMALEYLHNKKISHKEIRLDNVFLTAQGFLKLGTFKLSKLSQKQKGLNLGFSLLTSPYYSAPQCVQKNLYDEKSDIWALGCLLQQLCTLKNNNVVQNAQRVVKGKIQPLPLIYSEQLNQIYTNCLQSNPAQRPSAYQLLSHQYFLGYLANFVKTDTKQTNNRRIPIKKYKIHKMNQEKTKMEQLKTISIQKKQSGQTTMSSILTKKPSMQQTRTKQIKISSKQDQPYNIKVQAIKQIQKSGRYNFDRKSSIQIRKDRERLPQIKQSLIRSKSREIAKRTSLNKNIQNQRSEGNIKTQVGLNVDIEQQVSNSVQLNKSSVSSTTLNQSPKKVLAPPKPPKRKISGQNVGEMRNTWKLQNSQTKKVPQILQDQLKMSKSDFKQRGKLEQSIKSSVDKVIGNLLAVKGQIQQEQLSFQLDDDDDIRLTSAKNQSEEIVDTYNSKLQELIKWMQCKYSPNMQTIMQRTLEMDTTNFQKLKF